MKTKKLKTLNDYFKFVSSKIAELDSTTFTKQTYKENNKDVEKHPRDYQIEQLSEAYSYMNSDEMFGKMIGHTGCGKSSIQAELITNAFEVFRKFCNKVNDKSLLAIACTSIIASHRLELNSQLLETILLPLKKCWKNVPDNNSKFRVMVIGSKDESDNIKDVLGNDFSISNVQNSTNEDEISSIITKWHTEYKVPVLILSTYQSFSKLGDIKALLLCADEAHYLANQDVIKGTKVVDDIKSDTPDEAALECIVNGNYHKTIFFTATEKGTIDKLDISKNTGMFNYTKFGKLLHRTSYHNLVRQCAILPARVMFSDIYDPLEKEKLVNAYNKSMVGSAKDKSKYEIKITDSLTTSSFKMLKNENKERTVALMVNSISSESLKIFTNDFIKEYEENTKDFMKLYPELYSLIIDEKIRLRVFVTTSNTGEKEIFYNFETNKLEVQKYNTLKNALNNFKTRESEREHYNYVFFHLQKMIEGIDVPFLDGVLFLKPSSKIKSFQSIGRAMRTNNKIGKKYAYIFVPCPELMGVADEVRCEWYKHLSEYYIEDKDVFEIMLQVVTDKGRGGPDDNDSDDTCDLDTGSETWKFFINDIADFSIKIEEDQKWTTDLNKRIANKVIASSIKLDLGVCYELDF